MSDLQTSVLIVGGGPVGLTAALDLASRGIDVVVAEMRHAGEPPSVKCNHVSARSMEVFRRLGIVDKVRSAGLPEDFTNDVVYRTTATGLELSRIEIPGRPTRYTATGGPDTWWPTPEPPHRINQIYLEPILFACAAASARITILSRTEILDFEQDDRGIKATARDLDADRTFNVSASFMIGCDGGKSRIRKMIGGTLTGTPVVQRVQSTFIEAPQLKHLMERYETAWMLHALNRRRCGTIVAIDGVDKWLIHNHLKPTETEFDSVDRDWAIRNILGVDETFEYKIISKEDWIGRRLVADRFRDRRVFICGDAAHLWIPYAGYGMNAGIADAVNLSWLLAAHLNGWAPAGILDAYVAERQPITEQVSYFAMNHAHAVISQRGEVPVNIEDEGPEAEAERARYGQAAYDLNVQQFCCAGLNFGYYYDASPLIAYDGETQPPYTMADFTPSTVPGVRAPHVWLRDGRSLYDAFGPGYALLRLDDSADVSSIVAAAKHRDVPLTVIDLHDHDEAKKSYAEALVMVRPDQHIAWRGAAAPADPDDLLALLTGAAATAPKEPEQKKDMASAV